MGLKIRTVNRSYRSFPSTKMGRKVEHLIGVPQQSQDTVLDLTVTTTEGGEAWDTQGQRGATRERQVPVLDTEAH